MVHGFYAGMGGFSFSLHNLSAGMTTSPINSDCKRLTLTARGVALLTECKVLPKIEEEFLKDKSKSDGLSKFLACVQAAWLIVQVIGRLIAGVQVTLLEVNTLGHVFCALIIYVLWWHKPRMVLKPVVFDGDWVGPLCAYMYMSSRISSQKSSKTGNPTGDPLTSEIASLAFYPKQSCQEKGHHLLGHLNTGMHEMQERTLGTKRIEEISNDADEGGAFGLRPYNVHTSKESIDITRLEESQIADSGQLARWSLAAQAVCTYPAIKRRFTSAEQVGSSKERIKYLQDLHSEELIQEYCSNWTTSNLVSGDYGLIMGIALWFATIVFGGVHVAAWFNYFPSSAEAWLWRCSAMYMMWSGLVWLLINLCAKMFKSFDNFWNSKRLNHAPFVDSIPLAVLGFICGALYAFARIFLVLEAFISIRRLPKNAYQTPEWTQVIPHF